MARIVRVNPFFNPVYSPVKLAGKHIRRQARQFRQVKIQLDQKIRCALEPARRPDW